LISNEVVAVLQALGLIMNISDAILGLTIFAIGNSSSDLVADVTVARMGFPNMAIAACFGGPMLSKLHILLYCTCEHIIHDTRYLSASILSLWCLKQRFL
jgi:Ca2+/Na+ antiporter